jgi:hypothetical protein
VKLTVLISSRKETQHDASRIVLQGAHFRVQTREAYNVRTIPAAIVQGIPEERGSISYRPRDRKHTAEAHACMNQSSSSLICS